VILDLSNLETAILKLTDELRDDVLPELGVRFEDRNNERTIVKLCDKETLLKEREQKKMVIINQKYLFILFNLNHENLKLEQKKLAEKLKREEEQKEQKRLKELQMSIPPEKLFINEIDKYSKFDENVIFF
jgi:cysteinyl-tRNA synthetase